MKNVYWITGKKNSGKTTLSLALSKYLKEQYVPNIVLDGDVMRRYFPTGFSTNDRWKNIINMFKISEIAQRQGLVSIVAAITPYHKMRIRARNIFRESFKLIYVPGGELWEGTEYEVPPVENIYKTYNRNMEIKEIV